METSVAELTVSVATGEVTEPRLAVMSLDPTPAEVARPFEPAALLMLATPLLLVAHVTMLVRSCAEVSV